MMPKQLKLLRSILLLSSFIFSLSDTASGESPFTPRAHLMRYWNNNIYKIPRSEFLLSKASPLSAPDSATFAQLATNNALSTHLASFCKKANLLCFPDPSPNLAHHHSSNPHFSNYDTDHNFTNYGTDLTGGLHSFKNYSDDGNDDSFRRYSRDSTGHSDKFIAYAADGNVVTQTFNSYAAGSTGGVGQFKRYAYDTNGPQVNFTSYSADANGRRQSFSSYSDDSNAGAQNFASYGKNGNGLANSFKTYGNTSNVIISGFSSYSESGNGGGDNFTSYGKGQNIPADNFKNYGDAGNGVTESFSGYRENSNLGDDSFKGYAKNSNTAKVRFSNYVGSINQGAETFSGYGETAKGQSVGFKRYGVSDTFKRYAKHGVAFSEYNKTSNAGKTANRWMEEGKFFREGKLKKGTVMHMPDIKDKMPVRSFLPRSILSKIPFSSSKILEMKEIFHALDNSTTERVLNAALRECERGSSPGETKRCVGSGEDMIDFAVSVLGNSVELRTTESTQGSKEDIMIGEVRGINGGRVTHSVSCHQSLYPYLLYYCHSVPNVRVYEADILDPNTKSKINHGVAICHLDTSSWTATHGAFLALGSGPGKIEVCHWIFQNDLTWTLAD